MRVLQVHTRYRQRGGEDSVVEQERGLLAKAGHDVRLFEVANPTETLPSVLALSKAPWNRTMARKVVAAAEEFGADIVHVHNTWFALSPAVFRELKKAGRPVVATVHNYRFSCLNAQFYRDRRVCEDCLGRFPWRGIAHACYRDSRIQSTAVAITVASGRLSGVWHEDVDALIALTDFAASKLVAAGVSPERIEVKPNTVSDPGDRHQPPSLSSQVLFVGRLVEEKGILDLVDAWSSLESGLQLEVIGTGPLRNEVERRASKNVRIVGPLGREAVMEKMLQARALVAPSRWYEGLPMVMLEAMSAGLPLVVPDHGAMSDVGGKGAVVFEATDTRSLANALDALRSNNRMDKLGQSSRQSYLQDFSDEIGRDSLVGVYERVLAATTGRQP